MIAQRSSGSYTARAVEKQERSRGAAKEPLASPERLLTDRSSYIAYLESQLERVSAACLTVQSFDSRLEEAVSAVRCLEEKTLNLARLISCTQQFAEQQEVAQREAAADLARRLRSVEARLQELEQPGRAAEWEDKLRAVSTRLDERLGQLEATAEQRLQDAAAGLQAGLEQACHASHLQLDKKLGDAAVRLTELERRLRQVDEKAQQADQGARVEDIAARLGSLEGSVAHLAKSDSGIKGTLGALQAAVAQLRTALVALELRPPLGDAAATGADCLQWLERAREALKREVADIQQQHGQLAAGLHSAAAAAAAAPQSPQKALAAQVLSGLEGSMQREVGREVQALQLADQMLASVASTFSSHTQNAAAAPSGHEPAGSAGGAAGAAPSAGSGVAASADGGNSGGGWTIPAAPAPLAAAGAAPAQLAGSQVSYPPAPSSQQALSVAAGAALTELQRLASGQQQAPVQGGSSSSLRNTFSQMQQTLQSVCQLLGQEQQPQQTLPACSSTAARYLIRSSTMLKSDPLAASRACQAQVAWLPGGNSGKQASGAAAAAVNRSISWRPTSAGAALGGGAGGGSSAKEALRESVLGQKALAERRRRLQDLYAELQG